MPVEWITDGTIKKFNWRDDGSAGTAALILFFTLCHYTSERIARPTDVMEKPIKDSLLTGPVNQIHIVPKPAFMSMPFEITPIQPVIEPDVGAMVASLTYDDLSELTGLSRKLIAAGLRKLVERKMIWLADRASSYGIAGLEEKKRWAKLPGKRLLSQARTSFVPFSSFFLRSKHELNAMKMYLYFASVRDNSSPFSEPSFETIFAKTGVPERDIPAANSFLVTAGMIVRTRPSSTDDVKKYQSNQYYMAGHQDFFKKPAT